MSANPNEANLVSTLRQLLNGYRVTQMIYVAAQLGIADLLKEGSQSSDDLARATGTHPPSLYRLLRALVGVGILATDAQSRFALTPLGELLRRDVPKSQRAGAIYVGEQSHWHAWGEMLHSVQTGETGFQHAHGMSIWEYRVQHPDANTIFNEAMTANIVRLAQSVASAYDFASAKQIVDIGGGHGMLIAAILQTWQKIHGIVFDQPHVVEGARATLIAANVAARCELVGGDFFAAVPAGGDVYLLSHIIHDWDDERSIAILRNCQRAVAEHGRVLIIEQRIAENLQEALPTLLMDINMLVAAGGRERTEEEYRALCAAAGLELVRVIPLTLAHAIFEARRI